MCELSMGVLASVRRGATRRRSSLSDRLREESWRGGARLEGGGVLGQRVRVSLSTRLGRRKGRWRVSVCWGATRYLAGGRREVAARRVELGWEEKGEVGGSLPGKK